MCTEKVLYTPLQSKISPLKKRRRGDRKMDFRKVSFVTDVVRKVATRLNMPISSAMGKIVECALQKQLYSFPFSDKGITEQQAANKLLKAIQAKSCQQK